MDYVMEIKITAAAKKIAEGSPILETALDFGFETHTGFTRTFLERIGCSPQDDYRHSLHSQKRNKGVISMDLSTLKIRLVCEDDRDALWENVYSAMTPRQIMEDKILPSMENYKRKNGFLAIAELEHKAVMSMWVERLYCSPGLIYDSHYLWQNTEYDHVFIELLDGVKTFAQQLNMTALCLQERADSPYTEGFLQCGVEPTFTDREYKYYMLAI